MTREQVIDAGRVCLGSRDACEGHGGACAYGKVGPGCVPQLMADMLALLSDLPAPDSVNAVDAFCRRWGQCTSLAKAESQPCCGCTDYEPDLPALDVKERLEKAGAKVHQSNWPREAVGTGIVAWTYSDGTVRIEMHGLTLDRAVAALSVAAGKSCNFVDSGICHRANDLEQQLAAAQAEVERLEEHNESLELAFKDAAVVIDYVQGGATNARVGASCYRAFVDDHKRLKREVAEGPSMGLINELRNVIAAQRDRLARICETTARPDGGTKHAADNAIRHADDWLARNKAT